MILQIISIYNNQTLFEQMRESVFGRGGGNAETCEVIGLDNTSNYFSSAAEAYNYAFDHYCNADVLVFCHQDIIFLEGSIERVIELCMREKNTLFGAAGVKNAGHGNGTGRIVSYMASPDEYSRFSTLQKGATEEVFTLDECLIAANRNVFEKVRFDEKTCNGWHLYAADISMQCQVIGIPVQVFDANVIHLSGGNPDQTFYACEKRLVEKYRNKFSLISYTCGWAYTSRVRYKLLQIYRRIRYGV